MSKIFYTDYYLPQKLIPVEDYFNKNTGFKLPKGFDSYKNLYEFLKDKIGIKNISVIENKENTCLDICTKLLDDFFTRTHVEPADISYFIDDGDPLFTSAKEMNVLYYLLKKFGMNNASILSIDEACSGHMSAIGLLSGTLNEKRKYAIFLAYSVTNYGNRFPFNAWVQGDGAGILVMNYQSKGWKIVDFTSQSFGIKSFAIFHSKEPPMDLPFFVRTGINLMKKFLSDNNISIKDVYTIIPQNIGFQSYTALYPKVAKFPTEKYFTENYASGGHMSTVDTIRNITDFFKKKSIPRNAYVLLYTATAQTRGESHHYVLLQNNV